MSFVSTCSRFVKAGILLAGALVAGSASAQKPAGPPRSRNQPLNLNSTDSAAGPAARARAKARANDCEGALPLFDEAIRITIEPTLRRDRGACHDKLGNAQAGVDDYRAYLYARPESADAKDVEERIQVLEGQLEAARKPEERGGSGASANASISINGERTEANAGSKSNEGREGREGRGATSYDDYSSQVKRRDDAESSSLRMGSGGAFGFYAAVRGLFGTLNTDVGYSVGVSPRYAFNSWFGLVGELGFAGFGARAREAIGGIAVWVAPEFRVRLDSYASNSLLFAFGPGYERYTGLDRANPAAFNSGHLRGRVGFRHVFGANIALDLTFDPGVVFLQFDGTPQTITIGNQTVSLTPPVDPRGLLGGNLAFVVGF